MPHSLRQIAHRTFAHPEKLNFNLFYTPRYKIKMDTLLNQYIATLDEPSLIGLKVAREVFGKNFHIEQTQGYKEWIISRNNKKEQNEDD